MSRDAGGSLPVGTTVLSVNSATQITLSNLAGAGAGTIRFLPHGQGNGSTTFNVPDHRDRAAIGVNPAAIGAGASQRSARRLGETTGTETHTLTVQEMPPHLHVWRVGRDSNFQGNGSKTGLNSALEPDGAAGIGTAIDSNTSYSGGTAVTRGTTQAHQNLQPSLALNFIVKT